MPNLALKNPYLPRYACWYSVFPMQTRVYHTHRGRHWFLKLGLVDQNSRRTCNINTKFNQKRRCFACFCRTGSKGYLNRPSKLVVEQISTYRGRWIIPCCAWVKPNTNTPTAVGIDFSTLKYVNFGVALEHWKINTYRGRYVGIRFSPCRTG